MRPFKTLLIFSLLGPPIGAVIFILGIYLTDRQGAPGGELGVLISLMLFALPFSYLFGLVPALAAGLLVIAGQRMIARFGLWHVGAIGVVVGLAAALWVDRGRNAPDLYLALKVLTCLIPALICWMIARRGRIDMSQVSNEAVRR